MREAEILFEAITNIREELVEAALDHRFVRRRVNWQRYMGAAACLALLVTVCFGAVRLGLVGGMGGSSADNAGSTGSSSASSDSAAPESSAGGAVTEDAGGASGGTVADSGDSGAVQEAEFVFGATVLEVYDNYLLVEPLEGEAIRSSADRIMVSLMNVEELPALQGGDEILITFDGFIRESYPAQITASDVMPIIEESE